MGSKIQRALARHSGFVVAVWLGGATTPVIAKGLRAGGLGTREVPAQEFHAKEVPASFATPLSSDPEHVLYQVYVRAFADGSSTPDGTGDLAGLRAKLPEIASLGVDGLLLMPIFWGEGGWGYMPRDYFQVDPAYGNEADFRALVADAHARGIRIYLDAPVNHISTDSEWFRAATGDACARSESGGHRNEIHLLEDNLCDAFYLSRDPANETPYRDWHRPWDWGGTSWRDVWYSVPGQDGLYYYAGFGAGMSELKFWDFARNAWNAPVVERIDRFFDQWASWGADGFRIDAAKHFVEGETSNANPREPRNLELLTNFLARVREKHPQISFLAEIWSGHDQIEPYLPAAADVAFDFPFMHALRDSIAEAYGEKLRGVLRHFAERQGDIHPGNRIVFASNHDVNRLMSEWSDDERAVRLAHFLTLMAPGVPLLYYGEELGLHGRRWDPAEQRDPHSTTFAYPWSGRDASGGFPGGVVPVAGVSDNFRERNLQTERNNPQSLYNFVRSLIALRKTFPMTNATQLEVSNQYYGHVLGFTLVHTPEGELERCRTVITNFDRANTYEIDLEHARGSCRRHFRAPRILFSEGVDVRPGNGRRVALGPRSMLVMED
jgi:alpha-amylase